GMRVPYSLLRWKRGVMMRPLVGTAGSQLMRTCQSAGFRLLSQPRLLPLSFADRSPHSLLAAPSAARPVPHTKVRACSLAGTADQPAERLVSAGAPAPHCTAAAACLAGASPQAAQVGAALGAAALLHRAPTPRIRLGGGAGMISSLPPGLKSNASGDGGV